MSRIDVLAYREGNVWVVCSLDPDLASQSGTPGSGFEALTDALEDLGRMFDLYDEREANVHGPGRMFDLYDEREANVHGPAGPAPDAYHKAFDAGQLIGVLPLGRLRTARVRLGVSPYARQVSP